MRNAPWVGKRRSAVVAALLVGGALMTVCAAAAPAATPDANDLSLRVAALQALRDFDLSPEQMRAVRAIAPETAETRVRAPAKAPDKLRTALSALQDALLHADEDRVTQLQDDVDNLSDGDDVDLDDGVGLSDGARKRAQEVLRLLRSSQIAAYIAAHVDDMADPLEALRDGLQRSRPQADADAADWESDRDDIAADVGILLGGLDAAKCSDLAAQAKALLDRARGLSDKDFAARQGELDQSARQIVGDIHPMQVLYHWTEHEVAELLSNPQLAAAIDARLNK